MTGSATAAALTFGLLDSTETIRLAAARAIVAGYTGRDEVAVQHHIDELAAIGVAPPEQVPMFYSIEAVTVTTAPNTPVAGSYTSGEIEPVVLRYCGRYFLGVGSDHTDRQLETVDIADSKRACPKPLGTTVVEIDDWADFDWDACRARSWVDGKLYQDGTLVNLRTPQNLLRILTDRLGDSGEDLICFAGTLPLLDGEFTPGNSWDLELTLPDGRTLTHSYTTGGH
ncbi:DUF2848 domain-containing protein [Rhodococcus sp. ABRD24]|uniref:DUF2848 family protein n=1 Tax=Rhodococcus sp. ABRD24 TaxID=2507582 RepID=UPI00103C19F6|nr:DUF2848 family protein [Rhodococcus sp. ABRD24]QBJ97484.1 DUF2848 domain-containing protein [Rhodococcus sp. ABRD24]